ncbi:unnamed protein product [Rotaria sp. Silwood2]|nr:unnamed protein product [Rotaria sp. Silwood2]CAF3059593.1 unnamed protein product [Rotaria sp. Silwood2]CAF3948835.1 unnamed protein product [Rotaria sp. Silwood2]CAF4392505.1 unnamed protein product [Rotaria sp. Silwood2]
MESFPKVATEITNPNGEEQPLSMSGVSTNDEFDKILADIVMLPSSTSDVMSITMDSNSNDEQYDINLLIDSSNANIDPFTLIGASIDNDDLRKIIDSLKTESNETEQFQQSISVENNIPTYINESPWTYSPPWSVSVDNSPVEPKFDFMSTCAQAVVEQQQQLIKEAKSKKAKTHQQRSETVTPIDYVLNSSGCQPCTTVHMYNDFAYEQQLIEYDAAESKKIQIKCQPRTKYRPRTQNESKNSAHYVRCEEGIKPEYPTVLIPEVWNFQSDVNLIEVTLMGIDKQPHPYSIDNKTSSDTYEDHALIFKQNEQNVLYFRLTNEDFQNGYKTFMIEMIKSKQDNIITKELIRSRQLEQSMFRFTRIFQVGKGEFQRDEGSTEYSSIMIEAYGDVEIEHMGPRYGPMCGQEMVYLVLKGRILKNDLKIEIIENLNSWYHSVENFTKNGNIIYFPMPAFPFPQFDTMKVNILIYYKGEELHQATYLYKGSLDQELAELRLNDPDATTVSVPIPRNFDPFDFITATGIYPTSSPRKTLTLKRTKGLIKTDKQKQKQY